MAQDGKRRRGVIIGGSGLLGGTLVHHFKKQCPQLELLAPNSKKLSLRNQEDIFAYFHEYRPDFIINTAITAIDSDPEMAYQVNYLGCINLAKMAQAFQIPFIHISSAAVLPTGHDLAESESLPLEPSLTNYAKSKLMAEKTLRHLGESAGLDYTIIRMAIVYGKHDHKVQGFHKLLYAVAAQTMPMLFTNQGVVHSYSNARKFPYFVHHVLRQRQEFSQQTYHFVDPEPVELADIILTIKRYLQQGRPLGIYLPLQLAKLGAKGVELLVKALNKMGVEARMPGELMFLEQFYESQTLTAKNLHYSSFIDPYPDDTVYNRLPDLLEYYLTRWEHLNLISSYNEGHFDPYGSSDKFAADPAALVEDIHGGRVHPFCDTVDIKGDGE